MRNLFEADLVDLKLDCTSLLRRQAVVRRGRLYGLDLGTERVQSGVLGSKNEASYQADLASYFDRLGREWLNSATEQMNDGTAENLDSVKVASQLINAWPAECDRIELQSQSLKSKATKLRTVLESSGDNPLRNLEKYQQAIQELDGLGREVFEVRGQVRRLQQQIEMDRETIKVARNKDLAELEGELALSSLDADSLSEYLLGAEVTEQVENVLQWIRWTRRFSPTLSARRGSFNERGRYLHFPGTEPRPRVLVESLVLQGTGRCGQEMVGLEGTISGLTSHPDRTGKPTEVVIQTTGERPVLIQATFNGVLSDQPHDTVTIDIPNAKQPPRLLGNTRQLAVALSSCQSHVWVQIDIVGDSLSGELLVKQSGLEMTPQLNPDYDNGDIAAVVANSLTDVDTLEFAVDLKGTLTSPNWALRSNVGSYLADGMRQQVLSVMLRKNEQRIRDSHQRIEEQLRSAEQALVNRQQRILESLEFGSTEIEAVRADIASRVESTDGVVNPDSPLRESFLR